MRNRIGWQERLDVEFCTDDIAGDGQFACIANNDRAGHFVSLRIGNGACNDFRTYTANIAHGDCYDRFHVFTFFYLRAG